MQFTVLCIPFIFVYFRVLGGEDGSGAERHRGHRPDVHRQHHGALGAPPLLYHQGHISFLDAGGDVQICDICALV